MVDCPVLLVWVEQMLLSRLIILRELLRKSGDKHNASAAGLRAILNGVDIGKSEKPKRAVDTVRLCVMIGIKG
jgi:hypothetical protein